MSCDMNFVRTVLRFTFSSFAMLFRRIRQGNALILVVRASNFVCTVYTNRIVAFWRFNFGSYRLSLNSTFHSSSFSSPNRCAAGNHQDPALMYIPSVILTLIQNRINSFIFRPNFWITNYNEKEYFRDTNSSDILVCLSASFFSFYGRKPQSVSLACTLRISLVLPNSLPSLSTRPSTPKILFVIVLQIALFLRFQISTRVEMPPGIQTANN